MDLNGINSHQWKENLPNPASLQQMRDWQARLDTVCGREPDGTPRLRVVWLPDWNTQRIWDRYQGNWTLKCVWDIRADKVDDGALSVVTYTPIAPPRLAIEALIPDGAVRRPAGFERAGVDKEFVKDEAGQAREVITGVFHEAREVGPQYARIEVLCQHSQMRHPDSGRRMCCHDRWVNAQDKCLGNYRPFDDLDVERMARLFRAKLEWAKSFLPNQPLTPAFRANVFNSWAFDLATQRAHEDEALMAEVTRISNDLVKTYSQLTVPGARKGRISIPGA